ncbi:MAG: alpha-amylase family glycosyl hydrolase [Candidatus Cyclobacteriaceae bacterium M3_2C_046]
MNKIHSQIKWWQKDVIYQIYPRSFKDTNADGVGDLKGIMEKLDYLKWLGVDAVWISPFYPSPMADFGYDISDYQDIHPLFGTMADFDQLISRIHQKEMKLILDLVPNHTSDQHPWFQESRTSRQNPKRNWYIWRDPKPNGDPPNNWLSNFGGPAWTYDETTGQYYYHAFLTHQPDLNWRNPEVKKAMFEMMRFWLDKGVDGFRVDVIWHMLKDELYRDNPVNPDYHPREREYHQLLAVYSTDQPDIHDLITEMRQVTDEYPDRLLIGEIYLPLDKLVNYYGQSGQGVHLPFNFQLVQIEWEVARLYALINEYEGLIPPNGWPNWVLSNHDNPRILTRVGEAQARLAAVLLLTLRGTPTIYYGDELGILDVEIPQEKVQDPQGINLPGHSRDPQRTPMQWHGGKNAGFSENDPWLPLTPDYQQKNVESEKEDHHSMLWLYKSLLELRKQEKALMLGDYIPLGLQDNMMIYKRSLQADEEILVLINFGKQNSIYSGPEKGEVILNSWFEQGEKSFRGEIELPGEQAVLIKLRSDNH